MDDVGSNTRRTLCCGILLAVLQEAWFKSENTSELRHWYSQPTDVWPDVEGGTSASLTQFIR